MPSEPLVGLPVLVARNKRLGDNGKLYYDEPNQGLTLKNATIRVRLSTQKVHTMPSHIADVC